MFKARPAPADALRQTRARARAKGVTALQPFQLSTDVRSASEALPCRPHVMYCSSGALQSSSVADSDPDLFQHWLLPVTVDAQSLRLHGHFAEIVAGIKAHGAH